jgi:hypothetical protein
MAGANRRAQVAEDPDSTMHLSGIHDHSLLGVGG